MKFAEHLTAHITPEWRKQYINYEVSLVSHKKKHIFEFFFPQFYRFSCENENTFYINFLHAQSHELFSGMRNVKYSS